MNVSKVRKGDIVWARTTTNVFSTNNYSPAIVTSSNDLFISLSFFNNHTPQPRTFFLQSELIPFDQPFSFPTPLSPQNHDAFHAALRFFALNVVSSLTCPCITERKFSNGSGSITGNHHEFSNGSGCITENHHEEGRFSDGSGCMTENHHKERSFSNGSGCVTGNQHEERRFSNGSGCKFDPIRVLGFVQNVAVFPWVDDSSSCVVDAVKIVAQVHAFRRYSSIQQKNVYNETRKLGDNVKHHQCSKVHTVSRESMALEPKEKHHFISKQGEENMVIGSIRKLKPTVPVLEGNSVQLFQNELLIIPETPTTSGMHSLDLSTYHTWGKTLKLERPRLLRFKNIFFGNGSRMSEVHFSISSDFKTHLINFISKIKNDVPRHCSISPEIGTTICLNRKRKRQDKHALCHVFPKNSRAQENEGSAYISKKTRHKTSHIMMLEPEESIQQENQTCIQFSETSINLTDEVQNVNLKRIPNLASQKSFTSESSPNLMLDFHSDNYVIDASAAKVELVTGSNSSVYQKPKGSSRIKPSSGKCLVEGKDSYKYAATCSIFNSKVGLESKTHVPFCSKSLHMKFPKNFNLPTKEQLIKKFSVFGSVDSSSTKVSRYTGSAQVAFFKEIDAVAAYQYAKRKVWFGEANIRFWLDPFEHKRKELKRLYPMHPAASKLIGPPLKSCLKNSNSLNEENRKKHQKVRFTIAT